MQDMANETSEKSFNLDLLGTLRKDSFSILRGLFPDATQS